MVCEFGSRVLGRPLRDLEGIQIPLKWPVPSPNDPRLFWCIGWSVDHIGQTIHRLLFEPDLFRVIRDKETMEFRPWNEARDDDADRFYDSEPAGPVIPSRFIEGWHFHAAGAKHWGECRLTNGAVLRAYPSSAKAAKQGDRVSGLWIDEDIQFQEHLKEWQDRLTDARGGGGWFMWSVWPHVQNLALVDLIDKADEQKGWSEPIVEALQLAMSDNKFITDSAKSDSLEMMGSEEERARRDRGELLLDHLAMYDYNKEVHSIRPMSDDLKAFNPNKRQVVLCDIYEKNKRFPSDWTRYLFIDPSHTRTAVLWGVVPPPVVQGVEMKNTWIIENELVVAKCSATQLAAKINALSAGLDYEAFIMDKRMGQQTRVGSTMNVFETYAYAFGEQRLVSRLTSSGFAPGCDVPLIRYVAVREALSGKGGWPSLFIVEDKCPSTIKEFFTYRKKQMLTAGVTTISDEPANPRKHDCMAALEYGAAYMKDAFKSGLAYVPREERPTRGSSAYQFAQKMLSEQNEFDQKNGVGYVHLGIGDAV